MLCSFMSLFEYNILCQKYKKNNILQFLVSAMTSNMETQPLYPDQRRPYDSPPGEPGAPPPYTQAPPYNAPYPPSEGAPPITKEPIPQDGAAIHHVTVYNEYPESEPYPSMLCPMLLSCWVFWCISPLFGAAAFFVACK